MTTRGRKDETIYFKSFREAHQKQQEIGGDARVVQYEKGYAVQYWKSGPYYGDDMKAYRASRFRPNPTLAIFGNPPIRHRARSGFADKGRFTNMGTLSEEAHSISYRHQQNGQLYKHDFETPVSLIAATMGGKRVVIIVGMDDDIWDDYPDER